MKERNYQSRLGDALSRMSVWMLISIVLAVSNLGLLILAFSLKSPEKTIVVPADFNKSFWVQGDQVDPNYLLQMAEFFSYKLLIYSNENAEGQFRDVMKYADPVAANTLWNRFQKDLDDIKRKGLGSVYYITQAKTVGGKTVLLYGKKTDIMTGQVIGERYTGYQVQFDYRNGHLYVKSFTPVEMPVLGIEAYLEQQKTNPTPAATAQGS